MTEPTERPPARARAGATRGAQPWDDSGVLDLSTPDHDDTCKTREIPPPPEDEDHDADRSD